MVEVLVGIVGGLVVAQFAALWLRVGRVEDKLDAHCAEDRRKKSIIVTGGSK